MTDQEFAAKMREITGQNDNWFAFMRSQYDRMAMKDAEGTWSVYVQINTDNYVTAVESSAFLPSVNGWLLVDQGTGERYKYARALYCPKGLTTEGGYNYRLVDGVVVYAPQVEQPEDHNEMSSKEELFVASRKYLPGELISIQGRMYEVISIILPDAKITPNTNVKEITLEEYINRKVEEATAT